MRARSHVRVRERSHAFDAHASARIRKHAPTNVRTRSHTLISTSTRTHPESNERTRQARTHSLCTFTVRCSTQAHAQSYCTAYLGACACMRQPLQTVGTVYGHTKHALLRSYTGARVQHSSIEYASIPQHHILEMQTFSTTKTQTVCISVSPQ